MSLPLLDKGADLKRNDCVNIYAFRSVRVWGWSWRSGSISFHGRAHSLPPHARTLFYILPTIHPRQPYLRRYTGLLLRGACAPPWFPFFHDSSFMHPKNGDHTERQAYKRSAYIQPARLRFGHSFPLEKGDAATYNRISLEFVCISYRRD